jgi:putative phosphonate metabolism protein
MQQTQRYAHRYAVYLAPVGSWRDIGSRWLGRSEETGQTLARDAQDDPRLDAWTREPRHYGLHATLKPPFRLSPGAAAGGLDAAVRRLAQSQAPFGIALELRKLRGFLAWCLAGDTQAQAPMRALADQAVQQLDPYRAPATTAELARRQSANLSPEQQRMLARWGYPYVLDSFTFHITLTGHLAEDDLARADAMLRQRGGAKLDGPMPVDAISVYAQSEPEAPFVVARHYGFDGSTRDCAGARFLDGSDAS